MYVVQKSRTYRIGAELTIYAVNCPKLDGRKNLSTVKSINQYSYLVAAFDYYFFLLLRLPSLWTDYAFIGLTAPQKHSEKGEDKPSRSRRKCCRRSTNKSVVV